MTWRSFGQDCMHSLHLTIALWMRCSTKYQDHAPTFQKQNAMWLHFPTRWRRRNSFKLLQVWLAVFWNSICSILTSTSGNSFRNVLTDASHPQNKNCVTCFVLSGKRFPSCSHDPRWIYALPASSSLLLVSASWPSTVSSIVCLFLWVSFAINIWYNWITKWRHFSSWFLCFLVVPH